MATPAWINVFLRVGAKALVSGAVLTGEMAVRDKFAIEWELEETVHVRKLKVGKQHCFVVLGPGTRMNPRGQWLKTPEFNDRAPQPGFEKRQAEFDAATQFATFEEALKAYIISKTKNSEGA